jgi:hypothetical protein
MVGAVCVCGFFFFEGGIAYGYVILILALKACVHVQRSPQVPRHIYRYGVRFDQYCH